MFEGNITRTNAGQEGALTPFPALTKNLRGGPMAEIDSRRCAECEQHLPITSFRKNANMAGGYTNRCKPCLMALDRARWAAMAPEERETVKKRYRSQYNEYRRKNPEAVKAAKAASYQRHKAHSKAKCYRWRKDNPERLRELSRGWQFKRRALTSGGATAVETAAWAKRQKKVCHWCGKACAKRYDIDHITPLAKGGAHILANLCIACPPCNRSKGAKDPIDFAQSIGKLL